MIQTWRYHPPKGKTMLKKMATMMRVRVAVAGTLLLLCAGGLTAVGVTVSSSCTGVSARDDVLMPAAQRAWIPVRAMVDRGILDGVQDGDLDRAAASGLTTLADGIGAALDAEDRAALSLTDWLVLEPWAHRGIQDRIDDGEIGAGVGDSLALLVRGFGAALIKLEERS